jgi:hypothetical protein
VQHNGCRPKIDARGIFDAPVDVDRGLAPVSPAEGRPALATVRKEFL